MIGLPESSRRGLGRAKFGLSSKANGRWGIPVTESSVIVQLSATYGERESAMASTMSRAGSNRAQDTPAERWSRLYADVRASYGRASIQSALLLNGGASIALLAFLGNLAIAQQSKGLAGSFSTLKQSFVCFGAGVMLAASSNVVAFLIQIFSIAHPNDAEGLTGRNLRFVGIGMVVASLLLFAVGITVAANALGNVIGSFEVVAQR